MVCTVCIEYIHVIGTSLLGLPMAPVKAVATATGPATPSKSATPEAGQTLGVAPLVSEFAAHVSFDQSICMGKGQSAIQQLFLNLCSIRHVLAWTMFVYILLSFFFTQQCQSAVYSDEQHFSFKAHSRVPLSFLRIN